MLKIAIADDHRLFRKSLTLLLNSYDNLEVVIEAETGQKLLEEICLVQPDIVLLDIQMPKMDGFETCYKLSSKFPAIKILMLSQIDSTESIYNAMKVGAHGYFTKNSDPDNLVNAITTMDEKGFYFQQELGVVLKDLLLKDEKSLDNQSLKVTLSPREVEIIKLACKELTSIQIGAKLFITPRTVEGHKARIMERLQVRNFIGVILYSLRNGILTIKDL